MIKIKIWRSKDKDPKFDIEGYLSKERYILIDDTIQIDEEKLDLNDSQQISKFIDGYFFTYEKDKSKKYNYKDTYKNLSQYRHLYYPDIIQINNKYYMILDVGCTEVDMK